MEKESTELWNIIVSSYLIFFESFTEKNMEEVFLDSSHEELFNKEKFEFGQFVLHLHMIFEVPVDHRPVSEFKVYPTVEDLINHLYSSLREEEVD